MDHAVLTVGSSPRMRGAHRPYTGNTPSIGIIPAYAGSTRYLVDVYPLVGDHPRVCGEHQWEG